MNKFTFTEGLNSIDNFEFNIHPFNKEYYLCLFYQKDKFYRYYISTKHLTKFDKYFDFDRPQKDNDQEEISHYKFVKDQAMPILKLHHSTIERIINIVKNNKSIF